MVSGPRRYELLSELGSGGFGTVYRARFVGEAGFAKIVALKMLNPGRSASEEFTTRLKDEAKLLALLRHDAIVGVDRLTLLDGRWTIVMEYVEGVDLHRLISSGPLPPAVALEITHRVAGALDYAWRQRGPNGAPLKLLHRDLKPSNVRITHIGEVKILDFGIAKAEFDARESVTKHRSGTPDYMAPERWTSAEDLPASDVYSLGIVLLEMLSGAALGAATNNRRIHALVFEEVMRRLRVVAALPDGARELVLQMIAFDPDARPDARTVRDRSFSLVRALGAAPMQSWAEHIVAPLLERQDRQREHAALPPLATFEDLLLNPALPPLAGPDTLRSDSLDEPGPTDETTPYTRESEASGDQHDAAVSPELSTLPGGEGEDRLPSAPDPLSATEAQIQPAGTRDAPQWTTASSDSRQTSGAAVLPARRTWLLVGAALAVCLTTALAGWPDAPAPGEGTLLPPEPTVQPPSPAPTEPMVALGAELSPPAPTAPSPKPTEPPSGARASKRGEGAVVAPPEAPSEAPSEPAPGRVHLDLTGAGSVVLVGADGLRHGLQAGENTLPLGAYDVRAALGSEEERPMLSDIRIQAGQIDTIICNAEFGACKWVKRP